MKEEKLKNNEFRGAFLYKNQIYSKRIKIGKDLIKDFVVPLVRGLVATITIIEVGPMYDENKVLNPRFIKRHKKIFTKLKSSLEDKEGENMPLTKKGRKIKKAMEKSYGKEKGERVFYASQKKGTIKGTHKKRRK